MYWQEPVDETRISLHAGTRVVIGALVVAIVAFGVYPAPVINALRPAQVHGGEAAVVVNAGK
jgi:NADH:ubiquinone oxidoreductase subunit 4 (subunit M)